MKRVLFTIIILVYFLIGCGGGESSTPKFLVPHEGLTQNIRSKWESVNKPGESTLGILEKSLDGNLIEINLEKGEVVDKYIHFYIDSDRNEATGYKSEWVDGADYLIEEGRLYKSTANGYGWNWERIGDAIFNNSANTVYAQTTTKMIPNIHPKYRVAAMSLSNDWYVSSNIFMTPIQRDRITIDADVSDWSDISVLINAELGDLKIIDDDQRVYFLLQNGNPGAQTQIYLDIDKNSSSGYISTQFNNIKGADYLIENNRLYKSTADGKSWSWDRIGYIEFSKDDNLIEISVQKDMIGLEADDDSIKVGAIAWDATFDNDLSYFNMTNIQFVNEKSLIISEMMASNAHTAIDPDFMQFEDWLEIHNQTSNMIDISNYKVSDKLDNPKWTIPDGTTIPANGYMVIWADGEDMVANGLHTNFSFKNKGESVGLYDVHDVLIDGFEFSKQTPDISSTQMNGQVVFMNPTPGMQNSLAVEELTLSSKPTFSVAGGFYNDSQSVRLSLEGGATIYYTTDGSFPIINSPIYNEAIELDETTVIRARAFENGKLMSYAATQTYLINEDTTLSVISIATDDNNLNSDTTGIYTVGTNGAATPGCSKGPQIANFYQGWKRPANIEYFDSNRELGFSLETDIKISGSCSRMLPQKSLSISAKSKYEKDSIEYKLFPNKNITDIKGFKLKSAGQDWHGVMLRDAFMHQVIKDDMDVDYQDYRPSIVFINGEYWGIHNIREKKNEDFLAENHPNVDDDKVDILEDQHGINEGSRDNYVQMIAYIEANSLANNDNYSVIDGMMDVENYMDYIIAQTYFANTDWPYTNVRYWRESDNSPKWRWILEDLDLGLGAYFSQIDTNMLEFITATENLNFRNPTWSTFIFRSLIENDNFKTRFKQKYANYLDTTFETNRVRDILDSMTEVIRPEIPRHTTRWKDSDNDAIKSLENWERRVDHLQDVVNTRNETVRDELELF